MSTDDGTDPATAGDEERAVSTIPLDTDDGETVVISQQNVGPGNQVGGGEYKNATHGTSPDEAAQRQHDLDEQWESSDDPAVVASPIHEPDDKD